ncbi:MAG TPA: hypothetical protein VLA16_19785 [Ideonella sp.]|nr:hypothetical protein [Ideonella sp.]
MPDPLASLLGAGMHYLPPMVLLWLAFFFGRTLRPGLTPLIERVARRGDPALPAVLCRYTRGLTALWCGYFILAAALTASVSVAYGFASLAVWTGTVLLFVGEHWLRPWLFPGERFPGLVQQLRDTWSIWRT